MNPAEVIQNVTDLRSALGRDRAILVLRYLAEKVLDAATPKDAAAHRDELAAACVAFDRDYPAPKAKGPSA